MKKPIIIGVIAFAVIGIGVALSIPDRKINELKTTEDKSAQQVGESFENQGQTHIEPGATHDPYNSNPPTSGPHYAQPTNWGIYSTPLKDEQAIHNLEHGGIWISYKDIDEQTKSQLEAIAKANSGSVILSPRSNNDAKITLSSWLRQTKLDNYDEAKILEFIKANKNKSPEPIAQ